MSEQSELHSHERGRTAFEVPERKWPVVTRTMLKHTTYLGEPGPDENPLVTSLLRGYVLNTNVEIHLKRALQEAVKKRQEHSTLAVALQSEPKPESEEEWGKAQQLVKRLEAQLSRVQQLKDEWPLEIVN